MIGNAPRVVHSSYGGERKIRQLYWISILLHYFALGLQFLVLFSQDLSLLFTRLWKIRTETHPLGLEVDIDGLSNTSLLRPNVRSMEFDTERGCVVTSHKDKPIAHDSHMAKMRCL
jgi:hypothetical protein